MGDSEADTGRGIPEQEQFSTSAERSEFSAAVNFDPTVKKAMDIMSEHTDTIEANPESPMDELIDELLAEQKQTQPDVAKLNDIRRRIQQEEVLVQAQSVTKENESQRLADQQETAELDDREEAIREITKLVDSIPGFKRDIIEMADEVLGDMVEKYPKNMQDIFDLVEGDIEEAYDLIADIFGGISIDEVDAKLRDQVGLQSVDFKTLKTVYAYLTKTQNELIGSHSEMLKAVDNWRKEHHQKS